MERQGDMGDRKTCLHRREMRRLETGRYIKNREWRLEAGRNVYIEERCGDWRQVDIYQKGES
jgi:hypothetical protein